MATANNEIWIGIDNERVKLEGDDLQLYLSQLELDKAESERLKREAIDKANAKQKILDKLGLTEQEANVLLAL